MKARLIFIVLVGIFLVQFAYASYWVSSTGASTWANCNSSSPLEGIAACSLATANTNAHAGDVVYLRGGSYQSNAAINPSYNGSEGNMITFANYNGESVVLENCFHESICGVRLYLKSYIKVQGINVQNSSMMLVIDNGDFNEISNCTFNVTTFRPSGAYTQIFLYHNATNNWIHNNTFSKNGYVNFSNSCNDEGALLTLGAYGQSNDYTSYNLIENNTLFHGGHHTLQITSPYNVIRNNYFHNENWMNGSLCNSSFYGDAGNRNIEIGDESGAGSILIENNRIAYAGIPPDSAVEANNLVTNLELVTNNNIARYNFLYGSSGSGVMFYPKNGARASNNSLYSNTIYRNGFSLMSRTQGGIFLYLGVNNSIKNNIIYDNKWGNITWLQTSAANNTLSGNWYNETGNPLFINSTLGEVDDVSLPNLSLQESSLAINSGVSLTVVSALDSGIGTQLILDDSKYFQDGSWGPIGMVEPDWIAVSNTTNVVKIISINYSTNALTLNNSISRIPGDSVWLYKDSSGRRVLYGNSSDMGAYEMIEEPYVPFCGNNLVDPGEACDGSDINNYSCSSVAAGLRSGVLSCSSDCKQYNTSQCVVGDTLYALSCNRTDVNNTLNEAISGDIVVIPEGECDWNGSITLGSKSVLISGSGNKSTIIRNVYPASGASSSIFRINGQEGNPVRITNLWIKGGRSLGIGSGWNIYPYGYLRNMRIDHSRFTEGGQIRPEGTNWGVIDHCEFIDTTAEVISMRDWVSEGVSWNLSIEQLLGTGNSLVVEDNFFNSTNSSYHTHTITGACGSRYTYRNNVAYKNSTFSDVDLHGYCFDECTSGRSFEVYNNEFYALTNGYGWVANLRGGEGVVFNNSFIHNGGSYANLIYMQDYRAHTNCSTINRTFEYGGPINCMYVNGSDSSTWESVDRPCRYQVHNTFIWNNTKNGVLSLGGVKTEDAAYIVESRDYFSREPTLAQDGFDYSPYPYPHPLTLIDVPIQTQQDSSAPVISDLTSSTTNSSVTITFTTDEDANITLSYGTTISLLDGTDENATFNTSHSTTISSLTNNTLYYYNITVCDADGNCATNGTYNFTTNQTVSLSDVVELLNTNGDLNASYGNITACLGAISPGQTCLVYSGNYLENLTINDNNITLRSNSTPKPIVIGVISLNGKSNVTISNLELANWTNGPNGAIYSTSRTDNLIIDNVSIHTIPSLYLTNTSACVYVRNSRNVLIQNSELYNCPKMGINIVSGNSTDNTYEHGIRIIHNTIFNNSFDGIDIQGNWITIDGNTIYDNIDSKWVSTHPDGIQVISSTVDGFTSVNNLIIRNNIIRHHTQNIFLEGNSAYPLDCRNISIYNNVVYNEPGKFIDGVSLDGIAVKNIVSEDCSDMKIISNTLGRASNTGILIQGEVLANSITIKNNIISNATAPLWITNTSFIRELDYNLYYNNTQNIKLNSTYYNFSETQLRGYETNGLEDDPLLDSFPSPTLNNQSPAIDSGANLTGLVDSDIEGTPRPQGSGWDIGAYESNYTIVDTAPPSSITNLQNISSGTTWIYWNWSNPIDADFNSTIIYIDGTNVANTSNNYYNATGLLEDTAYTITIHTNDNSGNVNTTDVNKTARTVAESVGNLVELLNINGSVNATYTNISACAKVVSAGQTCLVYAGTYSEQVNLTRTGNSTHQVTLQAQDGVIMDGLSSFEYAFYYIYGRNYITISNFEIRNFTTAAIEMGTSTQNSTGIIIENCVIHDIGYWSNEGTDGDAIHGRGIQIIRPYSATIRNNDITKVGRQAIELVGGRDSLVLNNTIHEYLTWGIDIVGDYGGAYNHRIVNNTLYDIYQYDTGFMTVDDELKRPHLDFIFLRKGSGIYPYNTTIEGNLFYNNYNFTNSDGTAFIYAQGTNMTTIKNNIFINPHSVSAISFEGYVDAKFFGNTVYAPRGAALNIDARSLTNGLNVSNNIFIGNPNGLIQLSNSTILENLTMDYNVFNSPNNRVSKTITPFRYYNHTAWQALGYDSHSIFVDNISDILFTNISGYPELSSTVELTLLETSPAIDSGIDLQGIVDYDFAGISRPQGNGWDIGAYESNYTGSELDAPNITLLLPQDRFGVGRDVGFVFNATSLSAIANCSLLIDNLVNATNISITSTTNRFFVQNLSPGKHIWRIICVDEYGVEGYSMIRFFGVHNFTKFNGNTTNLLEVNLSNISRLTFENVSSGKIIFPSSIDLSNSSDLESHIVVSNNSIYVDSTNVPELNTSAILTIYNLSFSNPRVLKDGVVCTSCVEDSYTDGVFTFNVTSFSTYSSEETPTNPENSDTGGAGGGGGGGGGVTPPLNNRTNNLSVRNDLLGNENNIGNENNKTPEEIKQENFEKFEKKVNYGYSLSLFVIVLVMSWISYRAYRHLRKK